MGKLPQNYRDVLAKLMSQPKDKALYAQEIAQRKKDLIFVLAHVSEEERAAVLKWLRKNSKEKSRG